MKGERVREVFVREMETERARRHWLVRKMIT